MSYAQRLVWNAEAGQFDASLQGTHSPARSPSPSPFGRQGQWMEFRDEFMGVGCAPEDISLACNLVHTYLSADVFEKPVLQKIDSYFSAVMEHTGLKDEYSSLPDPVETMEGYENDGIEDPVAIKIRFLLKRLSEQHLAMVLRFPFSHSADRENAEWLCKMWLQTHYAARSRDRGQSRRLLYDLYANFENIFRLEIETDIKTIPGWAETGFVDNWADLDYKPGRAQRSPTVSRSNLKVSIPSSGKIVKRPSLRTPSHHARNRSGSARLELPTSPLTPRGRSESYTSLFGEFASEITTANLSVNTSDSRRQSLNITDSRRQSYTGNSPIDRPTTPVDEAARQPWFVRNNNPHITTKHEGNYPVWKTMFAHLVAGARLEYFVDTKKIVLTDVLVALGNWDWTGSFGNVNHRHAIVDFAYYIFLRSRAIHSQDAGFNRADLEGFKWPSVESLQLTVDRIKEYLTPVPSHPSMQPALSFLGHVSSSLRYCPEFGFEIGGIVRENGETVSYADLQTEMATHEIEMMDLDDDF